MSAESKRAWREANPDRYAEYERIRAQARRDGYWDPPERGREPRYCRSSDSYYRYESSTKRLLARLRSNIHDKTDRLEHVRGARWKP